MIFSVTSIGNYAFFHCSSLTSVIIGSEVRGIESEAFASCQELTDVYCLAEAVPSTSSDAFQDSYIEYATLHVPEASIDLYKQTDPWKNFKSIVAQDGSMPETPETPKCATPSISYVDGRLKFRCETEGVEYVSEITVADARKSYDSEVSLTGVYKVSVYATKTGYDNSDVATAEIMVGNASMRGDVNGDNIVNVSDVTTVINIILGKE